MAAKKVDPKKFGMAKLRGRRRGFIVAIDGPSGAGKSTVSRQLAEALGGQLLDTGAMYRSVAYHALKQGITEDKALAKIARGLNFSTDPATETLLVNGEDMGHKIRTEKVGQMASAVSVIRGVREVLTKKQRTLAKQWSRRIPVVVEGRDIGTVVFPNVPFKFYVTADAKVRAERRFHQLKRQGHTEITFKEILEQHESRDERDSTRKLAPLKCSEDAVVVDTSSMGIGQVVKFMRDHIKAHVTLTNIKKN